MWHYKHTLKTILNKPHTTSSYKKGTMRSCLIGTEGGQLISYWSVFASACSTLIFSSIIWICTTSLQWKLLSLFSTQLKNCQLENSNVKTWMSLHLLKSSLSSRSRTQIPRILPSTLCSETEHQILRKSEVEQVKFSKLVSNAAIISRSN